MLAQARRQHAGVLSGQRPYTDGELVTYFPPLVVVLWVLVVWEGGEQVWFFLPT